MKTLKKIILAFMMAVIILTVDFYAANTAHQKVMATSANFQKRLAEVELDFSGPQKQGCKITRIYITNAYQTCFVAWYGEPGNGIKGFTFIYHRPWPLSLFYGQTADSIYFSRPEYGIRLKQIPRDGLVNHLYRDESKNDN